MEREEKDEGGLVSWHESRGNEGVEAVERQFKERILDDVINLKIALVVCGFAGAVVT